MKKTLACALVALLMGIFSQTMRAQSAQAEFLPEVDLYWRFDPKIRLGLITERTGDTSNYDSTTIGPTVNFFVRPVAAKDETIADKLVGTQVDFGVGYRIILNAGKPDENRLELDAAPSYVLPGRVLINDRSRFDLRWLASGFDWRYRNRFDVTRAFKVRRVRFSPYGEFEGYYNIPTSEWNKLTYTGGVTFDLTRQADLQAYYEREHDVGSKPAYVNGFGLTLHVYLHQPAAVRKPAKPSGSG